MPKPIDRITRKWIRNKSDEIAAKHGCRFDESRGKFVCEWIEKYATLYEGPEAGKPLTLLTWHRDVLMSLFSWVHHSEKWGKEIRRFKRAGIWAPKKNGKQLALHTPIPTPSGWSTIRALKVGDKIFSEDGAQTTVIALHPINLLPCNRVHFSNGDAIDCDDNHLWKTSALQETTNGIRPHKGNQYKPREKRFAPVDIRTTKQIKDTLLRNDGARNHSVMLPKPIETAKTSLLLDPYFLGYWLGNGDSRAARITTNIIDHQFFNDKFRALGFEFSLSLQPKKGQSRLGFFGISRTLKAMGLTMNKHVPNEYLRASAAQRLALLQGLMDSDGTIARNGKDISFCSKSDRLKEAVCELLSSFGIKHNAYKKAGTIKSIGFSDMYWHVQFCTHSDGVVPFSLPRKVARMNKEFKQIKARSRTVQITAIESLAECEMRCITVDHPSGMFLCGKTMLPTHNSPLMAFIELYLLCGDGEQGQKVFTCAKDGKQAMIAQQTAIECVRASPLLTAECSLNKTTGRITHEPTRSFLSVISADNIEGQEGLNGSLGVDEQHLSDARLMSRLRYMGISRMEPLQFSVSTAGNNPSGYGKQMFDYGRAVEKGEVKDIEYFHVDYSLPEGVKDSELESNLMKFGKLANPAWGQLIDPVEFKASFFEAKRSKSAMADFQMYRLNRWQKSSNPWLDKFAWEECGIKPEEVDAVLKTVDIHAGLDLSGVSDMSAFVMCGIKDDIAYFEAKLWLAEKYAESHAAIEEFLQWGKSGEIILCPGEIIDYAMVSNAILDLRATRKIVSVTYDRHLAPSAVQDLQRGMVGAGGVVLKDGLGCRLVDFPQTNPTWAKPCEDFERALVARKIRHGNQAPLNWMSGHVEAKSDAYGNKRPIKPDNPTKKIDGIVAMVMAFATASVKTQRPSISFI